MSDQTTQSPAGGPSQPPAGDPVAGGTDNTNPQTAAPNPSAPTAAPTGPPQAAQADPPSLKFGQLVVHKWTDLGTGEDRENYGIVVAYHHEDGAEASTDRAEVVWVGQRSGPIYANQLEVVEEG